MNNPIVKILRFLLFFPICLIALSLVNLGFGKLIEWVMDLSGFWFFVVVFVLGGLLWGLFRMIASLLIMIASYICPVEKLGSTTISMLASINCFWLWYLTWTQKEDYSGWENFVAVILSILILELTMALIEGSLIAEKKHDFY